MPCTPRTRPTPGTVRADGRTHTNVVALTGLAGRDGVLSYPLTVRGFRFTYIRSQARPADSLAVTAIRPGTAAGGSGPRCASRRERPGRGRPR